MKNLLLGTLLFPFIWWISAGIISCPFTAGMAWIWIYTFDVQDWLNFCKIFSVSYPFLAVSYYLPIKNDTSYKINDDKLFQEIDSLEFLHLPEVKCPR